jgi:hypothetical protein
MLSISLYQPKSTDMCWLTAGHIVARNFGLDTTVLLT